MGKSFTFILFMILLKGLSAQDANLSKIDSIFQEYHSNEDPGMAVGIIKDGMLIYQKNYGLSNVELNVPISDSTVFNVGSVTKTFTALCVLLLEQNGKLNIDDEISQYLKGYPSYFRKIKIRNLLNHTSGIRDYLVLHALTANGIKYERDGLIDKDIEHLLKRQKGLDFEPGEKVAYSNSGYWLLGKIIQFVSGMSLGDFAQIHIFSPLNMSSTSFREDKWKLIKNRATGNWVDKEGNWLFDGAHTQIVGPSGIYSTIGDLLKWHNAFYRSEYFDASLLDKMITSKILPNGNKNNQGLGLELSVSGGNQSFGHRGASFGFLAIQCHYPSADLGVTILANRNDAYGMKQRADRVLKLLTGKDKLAISTKKVQFEPVKIAGIPVEDMVGRYWNSSELLNRSISYEQDTLWYNRAENSKYALKSIGKNKFSMMDDSQVLHFSKVKSKVNFTICADGQNDLSFERYEFHQPTENDMEQYIGSYYSEELNSQLLITENNGVLNWSLEGNQYQDRFKPLQKDNFLIGGRTVFSFIRNKENNITRFRYINTRANGLIFRKK